MLPNCRFLGIALHGRLAGAALDYLPDAGTVSFGAQYFAFDATGVAKTPFTSGGIVASSSALHVCIRVSETNPVHILSSDG